MKKVIINLLFLLFITISPTIEASAPNPRIQPKSEKIIQMEFRTIELINQIRAKNNLKPLKCWNQLCDIARGHSVNMAEKIVSFGHGGFEKRAKSVKSDRFIYAFGENVAYNFNYKDPVKVAVDGWMESSGHRKNILGDYNETGVGIAQNSRGEWYLTQLFAKRE